MKRIFIGVVAIAALLTTSAFAADLAPRMYTKAPPPVAVVYDWTGFYIGGNVGYSWGRSSDTSTVTDPTGTVLLTSPGTSNLDGIVGGGQIGYNWQTQNWVWGLEADIQGTGEKGSRGYTYQQTLVSTNFGTNFGTGLLGVAQVALSQKIDWFGTVRGRAGILVSPKVLLYATGGLAYGAVNSSGTIGSPGVFSTGTIGSLGVFSSTTTIFSNTTTNVGWTVGAGIEGVIGGNWTAKLEYLYVDLGRASGSILTTITPPLLGSGFLTSNYSSRITDNVLRVGVNYKFGG